MIQYINISKDRTYHSEPQLASSGRTGNGKSERQMLASALLELPRGEGVLAEGLQMFLFHWQDRRRSEMSIISCLSPMS